MLMTYRYAILLISTGRWQQAKTQQPIGVVGLVINYNYPIHVNGLRPVADLEGAKGPCPPNA